MRITSNDTRTIPVTITRYQEVGGCPPWPRDGERPLCSPLPVYEYLKKELSFELVQTPAIPKRQTIQK